MFGDASTDRNRSLPDATFRERAILFPIAAVILWMGLASPVFTRRMEASCTNVLKQMQRPQGYFAVRPGTSHLRVPTSTLMTGAQVGLIPPAQGRQ